MVDGLPEDVKVEEVRLLDRETPESIGRLGMQNWYLRFFAFVCSLVVMVGLAWLEWIILCYTISPNFEPNDLFFLWAVSPVAAVTAIMITLLIGVFRGFHGRDLDGLGNPLTKVLSGTVRES